MDMDRGVKGWIVNTAKLNYWRVASWYEFDDLVQDGYLHYQRIINKYTNVKQPAHIMALFKVAFTNHIHDLSKKKTKYDHEVCETTLGVALENIEGAMHINPDTSALVASMPNVLRDLISSQTDTRLRRPCRRFVDHRETTNEKLCRIVGADPRKINLLETLRSWLGTEAAPAV